MSTTRISRYIRSAPDVVYRTILDGAAVPHWMVPTGMTCEVHRFEAWEGGGFRVSLTYDQPTEAGKTAAHTDTYHGRFVQLVPNEKVVEVLEFETNHPEMSGPMTVTFTLTPRDGGAELLAIHENVPPGVAPADNEYGWRMSLNKLADLVEGCDVHRVD
ncbi:MAG: SRPBCC domain-containing protein [Gemmataceae bacterium]